MAIYVKFKDDKKWTKTNKSGVKLATKHSGNTAIEVKLTGTSINQISEEKKKQKERMGFGSGFRF